MLNASELRVISPAQFAEMEYFLAEIFYDLGRITGEMKYTIPRDHKDDMDAGLVILKDGENDVSVDLFQKYAKQCGELGFKVSAKLAARLAKGLDTEKLTFNDFHNGLQEFSARVSDEISGNRFFMVTEDEDEIYHNPKPFGEAVFGRFPGAARDAVEAGRCLVLERSTACVFHLMRIWEYCTVEYGKLLKLKPTSNKKPIKIEDAGWNQILLLAGNKLTDQKARIKKVDRVKWSRPLPFLMAIKDGYRNDVMHTGVRYSAIEAAELYELTRNYLGTLVKIL